MLVEINGKEVKMAFITNNAQWAASSVGALYQARWGIVHLKPPPPPTSRLHNLHPGKIPAEIIRIPGNQTPTFHSKGSNQKISDRTFGQASGSPLSYVSIPGFMCRLRVLYIPTAGKLNSGLIQEPLLFLQVPVERRSEFDESYGRNFQSVFPFPLQQLRGSQSKLRIVPEDIKNDARIDNPVHSPSRSSFIHSAVVRIGRSRNRLAYPRTDNGPGENSS